MKKIINSILLLMFLHCSVSVFSSEKDGDKVSPWGVSAHPLWDKEWVNLDQSFAYVKGAGIKWMREDFALSRVSSEKGKYNFEKYDRLLDLAEANGVQILPILEAYDHELRNVGRTDIIPIYEHLDEWRNFVREAATRYKGRIKYWEVWNEEDRGFWKPAPNASQYVKLLKVAYEEIRKADSQAEIVLGGLCYWNADYLQAVYNAQGKGYFDAIAVHAYGEPLNVNKREAREKAEFYKVLKDNGFETLPIFITEFGGTSFEGQLAVQQPNFMEQTIEYALSKLGKTLKLKDITIGLALSPRSQYLDEVDTKRNWLPNTELKLIKFEELQSLDPNLIPVLIGAEGLNIDEPLLQPLEDYVNRGGLLLGHDMVPFHTVHYQDKDGTWQNEDRAPTIYPKWGLHFNAWWMKDYIPRHTSKVATSEDALNFGLPSVENIYVDRFFTNGNLQKGDSYFPIIKAFNDDGEYIGDGIGLYTYKNRKGGILLSSIRLTTGYTEEEQATLLQKNFLTYIASGVKALFWYDLHSDGPMKGEREHNFGLLNNNWTAKPAYFAYNEMTKFLGRAPVFDQQILGTNTNVHALSFERAEDKTKVLAVWMLEGNGNIKLVYEDNTEKQVALSKSGVEFIYLNSIKSIVF